ncbi:MAG TPA: phosphate ABC transporter permease PstA [Actinomycetota bacterium]|nr:phosphate ABC transporter permease PstA [Actinomycetota bacterium]
MGAPPAPTLAVVAHDAIPVRRRPTSFHRRDAAMVVGCAVSSLALTWLLYSQILPLSGLPGFLMLWAALNFLMYFTAVAATEGRPAARDRTMASVITVAAIAIIVPLALILGYVTLKGLRFLRLSFFTTTMASVGPESPATETGGLQAIVGTLEQVGIAMLISVPLGVLTAVYLNEVKGRLARPTRVFVDAMSGVPSIVAGLFIYTVLVANGAGFSGFAAALALSILMLPTVTRTCEVVLRLVPGGLREASFAMGAPEWRTTWGVILPTARIGIVTATILGVARVIGETAPLIMTAFGSATLNFNPFSGAQSALSLSSFQLFGSSQTADVDRAWVFAFVLLALVLILFVLARLQGDRRRR